MQLDDSTLLNSELKEQGAMAKKHSELEELRSLYKQDRMGAQAGRGRALTGHRINLFHAQVRPINSPR